MEAIALLTLAVAATPLSGGFALSRARSLGPHAARRATAWSAAAAFALAVAVAIAWAIGGSASVMLLDAGTGSLAGAGLGAVVDGLTVLMLLAVSGIGAVVARYAVRYLDGDAGQARFCQWLAYTLGAVLLLVVANNLAMFFAAWVATSHGLHRLLTTYRDRPAALLAARKKFLISRLGDAFLLVAFACIHRSFGSFEFAAIFGDIPAVRAAGVDPTPIALLLVLGAMTKSAQFPFHTWLPDSMETPTPVSALMHAGIINAGGFLLMRMSPLVVEAPVAMAVLAAGGAFTAVFAAVVMLCQTDVKRKYAYSTVSQMGFMMLQCGLGAFGAAALHLVGHSFYKGHGFLSAASSVDPDAGYRRVSASAPPSPARLASSLLAGSAIVATALAAFGIDPAAKPGMIVLSGVLSLAIAQLLVTGASGGRTRRRLRAATLGAGVGMAFAYFTGVALVQAMLGDAVATESALATNDPAFALALLAPFVVAFAVQTRVVREPAGRLVRTAYVHAHNGFYLGAIQNRIVEALWPPTPIGASGEESPR